MDKNKIIAKRRLRRRNHNRNKLRGDAGRPRMCVHRSLKHFGCQLVDDSEGRTLVSLSTRDKDVRPQIGNGGNVDAAAALGKLIAEKATAAGITKVRFDRGHNKYHGRVKAFAESARENGLQL